MRCSAGTSWTAKTSDFDQNLVIDLGDVKNITRIEIQGRPHSTEYVTEFSISYGYNGLDYQDFKEPGGNTKVTERANESSGTQINIIIDPKRRQGPSRRWCRCAL